MSLANKEIYQNGAIREFEKPEVREAIKVANANRWTVCLSPIEWDEREARLKKEYEKNTKAPGSGEEQPKEGDLKAATKMFGAQAREIMRLTAENAELRETIDKMKEGNPALKEALKESASQFNDALLDEQGKKIEKLANENERLKDQITVLNACKKHNDKIDRKQIKCLGKEIARLNKIIHKKNLKNEELRKELDVAKKQNTAVMVDMTAKCFRAARESINDVFESYAAKYAKSTLDELKEKAYNSFNAKACNLGLVGSKDGNGIIDQMIGVDIAEEGGDHSAIIAQCCKNIAISKDEAEIIERCTKNGTELHYSEKDGFTYTNMYGEEMPIKCLRGLFHVFTDEELKK